MRETSRNYDFCCTSYVVEQVGDFLVLCVPECDEGLTLIENFIRKIDREIGGGRGRQGEKTGSKRQRGQKGREKEGERTKRQERVEKSKF